MNYETDEIIDGEESVQTKKKQIVTETLLVFNDYFRVKIASNDSTMVLERRIKYDDGSDGWVFDGYFGEFTSMFKDMFKAMVKMKVSQKAQTDMKDLLNAYKESEREMLSWLDAGRAYENSKSSNA
jgi:hypothetical protein